MSDLLFHKRNRFWVFEIRGQKLALHLHDLLLTEQPRHPEAINTGVGEHNGTYPAVTQEKTSSTTLFKDTLLFMSAKALSQRG